MVLVSIFIELFIDVHVTCWSSLVANLQITLNAHASVSYMLAALGVNVVPTMPMIYLVFASLVSFLDPFS